MLYCMVTSIQLITKPTKSAQLTEYSDDTISFGASKEFPWMVSAPPMRSLDLFRSADQSAVLWYEVGKWQRVARWEGFRIPPPPPPPPPFSPPPPPPPPSTSQTFGITQDFGLLVICALSSLLSLVDSNFQRMLKKYNFQAHWIGAIAKEVYQVAFLWGKLICGYHDINRTRYQCSNSSGNGFLLLKREIRK